MLICYRDLLISLIYSVQDHLLLVLGVIGIGIIPDTIPALTIQAKGKIPLRLKPENDFH